VIDANILLQLDALQVRYIEALDGRNMRAWAKCFSEEGSYICTTQESEEQNLPLALMMDHRGTLFRRNADRRAEPVQVKARRHRHGHAAALPRLSVIGLIPEAADNDSLHPSRRHCERHANACIRTTRSNPSFTAFT